MVDVNSVPDFEEEGLEISSNGNTNKNIVTHLIESYGGINALILSMTNMVKYFPKFKKGKKAFSIIGNVVSGSMMIYDLVNKIRDYYVSKSDSIHDKKTEYIHTILNNTEDRDYRYSYDSHELKVTTEHLSWLVSTHNDDMGGIVVKSYYDLSGGKKFDRVPSSKQFAVLVEFKETLMLLEIEQMSIMNSNVVYTFKKLWTLDSDNVRMLVDTMNARYMDSVGFDNNVISYDGINIITRERSHSVDFEIKSFDFNGLVSNIKMTLDEGSRRGILFTGNPGTGKTSVMLKIEEVLTEYPVMYVTANNLNDEYSITRLESFIHNIGKCVVLIEDMDSLEIDRKTKKIAPILSLLDNSRNMSPVVFVATINDASLITPSIVRTGRFDEVIEIKEPTCNEEIYGILKTAWSRQSDVNIDSDLSPITYMRMKRHNLTQSDYCEIVAKLHLRKLTFNDQNVIQSMKELVKSKNTFKKYKHKKVK